MAIGRPERHPLVLLKQKGESGRSQLTGAKPYKTIQNIAMIEEYDEYGEIKPRPKSRLSQDQQHRIHQTKDIFDSECVYCRKEAKTKQSHWEDDE